MKSFFKTLPPIHPMLFAILPVLYLYCRNIQQLPFEIILAPMAVLLLSTLLLWFLGKKLIENDDKLAIYISAFWLWFFFYNPVRLMLVYDVWGHQFYRHRYFIGIWLAVLLSIFFIIFRLKYNFKKIGKLLTIFCLAFLVLQMSTAVRRFSVTSLVFSGSPKYLQEIPTSKVAAQVSPLPSVFYIILDSYAGEKELKSILGFDNSEFLNYLAGRGFYIAHNSHCNYSWTALSMSATLNLQYLPMKQSKNGKGTFELNPDIPLYLRLINNNQVMKFFKSIGYHIISLTPMNIRGIYYRDSYLNSFNMELLKMTILSRPLIENYIEGMLNRNEVKNQLNDLENVPKMAGPTFTYAHFLIPHPPYVFSRDGRKPPFSSMALQIGPEKNLYIDQLVFANKAIAKVIEKILYKSKTPPIIIIQGDHGAPRLVSDDNKNRELRMGILNAYYFPNNVKRFLYETITPVNTFRIILNNYFGQNLPLLEDKSYFVPTLEYKDVIQMDQTNGSQN